MQIVSECYDCILKRAHGILDRENYTQQDRENLIKSIETQNILLKPIDSWLRIKPQIICPAQLGSNRQKYLEELGLGDTYTKEKLLGEKIGKYFLERTKNQNLTLTIAVKYALFGNGIEFDVGGNYTQTTLDGEWEKLQKLLFNKKLEYKIEVAIQQLHKSLRKGDLIIYLLDNVGEHYLDLILIQSLIDLGYKVEIVVKGRPVLNDICLNDDLELFQGIKIWDTNNSDVGLFLSRIPENLLNRFRQANLLIVKGMAQFETLSSEELPTNALFLLKAKCVPVSKATKVNLDDYAIHWQQNISSWL
ncbi:MAG: ARMT1-like domain-containing protein [Candidatus Kariarchaeaceae archaeon]|jgi:uncharacterized protein with ATP-grasp and redox domains